MKAISIPADTQGVFLAYAASTEPLSALPQQMLAAANRLDVGDVCMMSELLKAFSGRAYAMPPGEHANQPRRQ